MSEPERTAISDQPPAPIETLYVLELVGPNGIFHYPFYATNETQETKAQELYQKLSGCKLREIRPEPYGFHLRNTFFPPTRAIPLEPRKGRRRKEPQ